MTWRIFAKERPQSTPTSLESTQASCFSTVVNVPIAMGSFGAVNIILQQIKRFGKVLIAKI